MTIERINSPDPIQKLNKSGKTYKSDKTEKSDAINVSDEAKNKAEIYNATEAAKAAPSVRKDRVEEVKKKLEDPNYINQTVLESVADKVMKYFEI
ncbi:MAG: flagellar biosynthesis anti-sigma factor FlgM [Spirochaetales bacterium]|nr:flagellar biosynthesis anti-sigma factor FlgM [Spirochaetales bacterium]